MNKKKTTKAVLEYSTPYSMNDYPLITSLPQCVYDKKTRQLIMRYLRNSDFIGVSVFGVRVQDAFTGEKMPARGTFLTDGIWKWTDDLWLYVRDYDIALPDEFVEHVKSFFEDTTKEVHLIPYHGDLMLFEGECEFVRHYKGRVNNYLWHDETLQIVIDGTKCFVDISVFHLQFDIVKREGFFPIVVYVEDKKRVSQVYERLDFQLFLDGTIFHEDQKTKNLETPQVKEIYEYIKNLGLEENIDIFIEKEQLETFLIKIKKPPIEIEPNSFPVSLNI